MSEAAAGSAFAEPIGSRTLRLTLKRGWFEMVERGEKREEYREASAWINSRVNASKHYDAVEFRNGYRPESPTVLVEYLGFRFGPGKEEWGACRGVNYVVIRLGRILSANRKSSEER